MWVPSPTKPRRTAPRKTRGAIDPALGQRIRRLRLAKGLTQADLAGGDFSKGFISLIETGRTRISLHTAEILARQLELPVSELLAAGLPDTEREREFLLLGAERELGAGRPAAALDLAEKLGEARGPLRARVQRLRGRALAQTTRSREAVQLLEEALQLFRSRGEKESAARTLFDLAVAHARLHEPGEALNLALECQGALMRGDLIDRTLELQVRSLFAAIFVSLGDFESADLQAERAAALAQDVTDRNALATLYGTLALTRQEAGDLEAALTYARRALQIQEELGRETAVANAWQTLGWIYVQRKQYRRAAEALARAERMAEEIGHLALAPQILATRAELQLSRGHFGEAAELAERSARHTAVSPLTRGSALLIKAQALAAKETDVAQVRAAFEAAIEALEDEPRHVRARAHAAFADALSEYGEDKDAYLEARKALDLSRLPLG